jgi:uncharacterized cupredoxin-like copper-binding protein
VAVVPVVERDFHIGLGKRVVRAGEVDLSVANRGPEAHELIVVRAAGAKEMPLRSDGLTVNEEALQRAETGSLEPGQAGAVRQLRVHLTPGRYELFCNMSGHYMGGMEAELVVR